MGTSIALWDWLQKTLVWFMLENALPMFSSRSFMVSCLIFKYANYFDFIFVYGVRECANFTGLCMLSSFPNTTCWRDCLFFILYSHLLCQRLIDCGCVGLFLDFLFCSIDLYVSVCTVPCCFDYCSFVVFPEVWKGYASCFVLFPQGCFAILGFLWPHINFMIIHSSSVKMSWVIW